MSKHRVCRIKELPYKKLKELLLHTTLVNAKFTDKLDSQWLSKVDVLPNQRIQGILNNGLSVYFNVQEGKILIHGATKGIRQDRVKKLLVHLLFLLNSAINEQDIALALAIQDPWVVDNIVVVDEAHVRVLLLLQLLSPILILHGQVNLIVEVLVLELIVRYLIALFPLRVCLEETVQDHDCLIGSFNVAIGFYIERMTNLILYASHDGGESFLGELREVALQIALSLFEVIQVACNLRINDLNYLNIFTVFKGVAHQQDDETSQNEGQNHLIFGLDAQIFLIDVFLSVILEMLDTLQGNTLEGFDRNNLFILRFVF